MEPMKFWELVEIYRWIPRLIISFQERIEDFKTNPTIIAEYLCLSAIRNDIDGIEFHPWEKLDLSEMPSRIEHQQDNSEDGSRNECHTAVFHECFYHGPAPEHTFEFSGVQNNMRHHDWTVGMVISDVLKAGNVPDALVRVRERYVGRLAHPHQVIHNLFRRELPVEEPFSYSHTYEIFLPPQTLSLTDLR